MQIPIDEIGVLAEIGAGACAAPIDMDAEKPVEVSPVLLDLLFRFFCFPLALVEGKLPGPVHLRPWQPFANCLGPPKRSPESKKPGRDDRAFCFKVVGGA